MPHPVTAPAHDGDRHTVVLLHSLGTDRRLWRRQVPALSDAYEVLTPETRGHGEADWPGEATLTGWVSDLDRVLQDRGPVHLVGLSMGGLQAVAYAGTHPEKVRSLVVANSFARLPADVAEARVQGAAEGIAAGMDAFAEQYLAQTLTRVIDEEDHSALRGAIAAVHPGAYLSSVEVTFRADVTPWFSLIACPTLVVAGEHDHKAPLQRSQEIADGIDGAALEVVAGAGHLSCLENAGGFNKILTSFLGSVDAGLQKRHEETPA
ncbi:alpha/beta fold hydrolase [Pseudonocardia kunmingensis]|uniref:3-oxoadipate enol-lactonase n=1 Tax=Pseudonocardia kunmingensis TaxID=630975 RepID=A0A543DQF7_9PSEU|nr:alpha/beta fold hydrolase [Pseudonocardia kunmingensis]TQM11543.1 3-oxoadipate enol-lactonase [Pseudonocardia kunmingensis]